MSNSGQRKSQQLLRESGSGKRKQIESKMAAETKRPRQKTKTKDQNSRHQDDYSPVPGGQQKRQQLTLVLLGESGSGKSASGNTILGMKVFTSKPSSMPVTTECEMETKSIYGTKVNVIDTPDFFDDSLQEQSRHIQECIRLCEGGLCVYLLVIQIGRFTEGERDILERLEKALETTVRDRAIILFTRGDDLRSHIDEFVRNPSPFLKKLIGECGGRYQVFNNRTSLFFQQLFGNCGTQVISNTTSQKREAEKQVKELMGKIGELVQMTDGVKVFPEYDGAEKSRCVIF